MQRAYSTKQRSFSTVQYCVHTARSSARTVQHSVSATKASACRHDIARTSGGPQNMLQNTCFKTRRFGRVIQASNTCCFAMAPRGSFSGMGYQSNSAVSCNITRPSNQYELRRNVRHYLSCDSAPGYWSTLSTHVKFRRHVADGETALSRHLVDIRRRANTAGSHPRRNSSTLRRHLVDFRRRFNAAGSQPRGFFADISSTSSRH